jgi:hypothetical protein
MKRVILFPFIGMLLLAGLFALMLARLSQLAHRFRGFPRFHLRNALICLSTAGAMGL